MQQGGLPDLPGPLRVIGVARTGYGSLEVTPIQSSLNRAGSGTIEIAAPYADALDGLAGFDYAWLVSWLHQARPPADRSQLRQVPFLLRRQGRRMGIFATRGPRRPNPIGLSLIRLLEVTASTVTFTGTDLLDGTPVLDIKPYVARFDHPPGEPRCGWFDEVPMPDGATPAGLADDG